ncbi:MAG: hypothetical protein GXP62_00165, partial [Oligoflexia bacterium]|nr:hypothetical protein [Oligoflexia bacterium]
MPRPPRIDFADARHHVYNRGARKEAIFSNDDDCVVFLSLLGQCQLRFGTRTHAYALMGNHFHLLVSTPRANLSPAMAFLQSRYARHLNRVHRWDGPIFAARFRNRVVQDEGYWKYLLAYLHLNPVKAHLVAHPADARWTSHRAYMGLESVPDWLETAEMLELFGSADQLHDYVLEVQVGRHQAPDGVGWDKLWTPLATDTVPKPRPRGSRGTEPTQRGAWPGVVAP